MSYLKIPNLYKDQTILFFKECFCLEKIHGTSTNVKWKNNQLSFSSGGKKYDKFVALFNKKFLVEKFEEIGCDEVIVFGEGYGGKQQGMSETYGSNLKFCAFEVKVGNCWLDVPLAEEICKILELEFVHYVKTSTSLDDLDAQRDAYSVQAVRNGCGNDKIREGIVIRPLIELTRNNGARIICKYKRDEFRETKSPRPIINPHQLKRLEDAELIKNEWVTKNRLKNVLQKIPDHCIKKMGLIIRYMLEDISIEGKGEIVWNENVKKSISKETALMYKNLLEENIEKQ